MTWTDSPSAEDVWARLVSAVDALVALPLETLSAEEIRAVRQGLDKCRPKMERLSRRFIAEIHARSLACPPGCGCPRASSSVSSARSVVDGTGFVSGDS